MMEHTNRTTAQDVMAILYELRDAGVILIDPVVDLLAEVVTLGYDDEDE